MHARLAVAAAALNCPHVAAPMANLMHRSLVHNVNAHARLVFGTDAELLTFVRAVKSDAQIPQDSRTVWLTTLARLRQQGRLSIAAPGAPALDSLTELDQLRTAWRDQTDVAVVADALCQALGIPAAGVLTDPGRAPEVATASAVAETSALRHLQALVDSPVAACGSSREEFWEQVLKPLAVEARSAVLLDGYLFRTAWERSAGKAATKGGLSGAEHVGWLLRHLDNVMAPGGTVTLIAKRLPNHPTMDAEATSTVVRDLWQPAPSGRLSTVTAVVAGRGGQKFPHDRHVRFSSGAAISLSAGFDRLSAPTIADPDGMAWTYSWTPDALQVLRARESRALSLPPGTSGVVLAR